MGMTSFAQWSGLGFAPFSMPDLALFTVDRRESFVTEWATGFSDAENRSRPRQAVRLELLMTDPTWCETENPLPIRGECLNLSDDGLYAVISPGYGLAVGQRYLFQLRPADSDAEPAPLLGIIVRAERLAGENEDQVAVGVRLIESANRSLCELPCS